MGLRPPDVLGAIRGRWRGWDTDVTETHTPIIEQLADISEAQRLAHELPYMRFMLPNQNPLKF